MNIEKLYQTIKNWFYPSTVDAQSQIVKKLQEAEADGYFVRGMAHIRGESLRITYIYWDANNRCPVIILEKNDANIDSYLLFDYRL